MQTFLPYPSLRRSIRCLDNRRLGKQRVEAYQILRTLLGETSGWRNHPAVRMWQGHEETLLLYLEGCIAEYGRRGFRNDLMAKHVARIEPLIEPRRYGQATPPWIGNEDFHASHRSNLLRKDPDHYGQFGWCEPLDLPYVWPVTEVMA